MIAKALDIIMSILNRDLNNIYGLKNSAVTLARLKTPNIETPLILSVVQISEDRTTRQMAISRRPDTHMTRGEESGILQIDVMVSANPQVAYPEGLQVLSSAIAFLNVNSMLSRDFFPQLPPAIARITIERLDLSIESQSSLWLSLDAAYQPSVIYKMRVTTIPENPVVPSLNPETSTNVIS